MGQKVHPKGFRLGVIEQWDSKWFARREYADLLHEDLRLRKFLKERLYHAGISKVEIERAANKAKINIYTARPGIVIGKKGAEIEKLKSEIGRLTKRESFINIHEVRRPDVDAQLVAENVALQLERRVAFRRAMKEAVGRAMRMGAQGVKVQCAGRLGGAEIARTEWYRAGSTYSKSAGNHHAGLQRRSLAKRCCHGIDSDDLTVARLPGRGSAGRVFCPA